MRPLTLYIFLFILLNSCGGTTKYVTSNPKCMSTIIITKNKVGLKDYFKVKMSKSNGIIAKKGNYFDIWFERGFKNDTIQAFINGKLLGEVVVSTDPSIGTTEKGFRYKYKKNESNLILKIVKNGKDCMEITLDKKFRQLFISFTDNKWEIIFDNIYPFYS